MLKNTKKYAHSNPYHESELFYRRLSENAKECAKIDVQNTLEAVTTIADKKYEYYQEVLNELNKM